MFKHIQMQMFAALSVFLLSNARAMQVSVDQDMSANLAVEEAVFRKAFLTSYQQLPAILEQISKKYASLETFLTAAFEDEHTDFNAHKANTHFVHAKADDAVVGYMSFDVLSDGSAYIRQLAVDPDYAKHGIGRLLTLSVFKSHPSITKISLLTRRVNTPAIAFYQHLGFKITEFTHEGYNPAVYVGMEYTKE